MYQRNLHVVNDARGGRRCRSWAPTPPPRNQARRSPRHRGQHVQEGPARPRRPRARGHRFRRPDRGRVGFGARGAGEWLRRRIRRCRPGDDPDHRPDHRRCAAGAGRRVSIAVCSAVDTFRYQRRRITRESHTSVHAIFVHRLHGLNHREIIPLTQDPRAR